MRGGERGHAIRVSGCGTDGEVLFQKPRDDPASQKPCSAKDSDDPFWGPAVTIHLSVLRSAASALGLIRVGWLVG